MLKKTMSLLLILSLIGISNLSILSQTQSSEPLQTHTLSKKKFFDYSERANELLDKDSFVKVNKDSLSPKAMQDADKAQQKKKFAGIGTTTAIVIGGVLVAAIIIVLASKHKNQNIVPLPYCDPGPCR